MDLLQLIDLPSLTSFKGDYSVCDSIGYVTLESIVLWIQ